MILRLLGAFLLLIAFVSLATQGCTCSQASPGKCPGLQQGDVVFLGTVTAVEDVAYPTPKTDTSSESSTPPVDIVAARLTHYHFHVDERFAGPETSEIDVFSGGPDDGDCAYRFKQGEQYVVFTQQETEGRLFATICNGTRLASDARALIPQLRAMRRGAAVASVFGVLRRADPPFLAPPDDPDDPLPNISLKLRSPLDRFETSSGPDGVYSFYDVHAGEYRFTANVPPRTELTQKTLSGGLPPFKIPDGACYEYDVFALPTGHIRGSVLGADGKPVWPASVEIYRDGAYSDSRPGLWAYQGDNGIFDFDHIGPGDYILVFNRANVQNPNAPYPRAFYPGVAALADAKPIHLKDGEQLMKVNLRLKEGFPSRRVRVRIKWQGTKPAGSVTVMAKADQGQNPAARKIADGLYEFSFLESANYTVSAWENLAPQRSAVSFRSKKPDCPPPARVDAQPVAISGSDTDTKELLLVFPAPGCAAQ